MQNNPWFEYPKNQPNEQQKFEEFIVAYKNPHFINKKGFTNKVPRHRLEIMAWTGDSWMDCNHRQITHFQALPSLPTGD